MHQYFNLKFVKMITNIKPIILGGLAGNCYLIENSNGFILIDTGSKTKRRKLIRELKKAGCSENNLKLIILTHGDFDHTGNCAFLKDNYNAKIAMHKHDVEIVRSASNSRSSLNPFKKLLNVVIGINSFIPDFTVDDGYNLKDFGINARIVYLPGYSKGSIGILTENGELFCGDLFINEKNPELNRMASNKRDIISSSWKLKNLYINMVYPGHGLPFSFSRFKKQ